MSGIAEVLAREQVYCVFQPIVDLDTDAAVGYEALARGPVGDLQGPDQLFAAAAAAGRLADLDELCQRAALRGAISTGIFAPLTLFVNVEPEVVDPARLDGLLSIAANCPGELQLMLEITERALAVRPADLLATVRRLRAAGWRIALDDVGADDLSLAFMPLLRPDVVKLDMALVQRRPGRKVAEIMNAVNSYAERTGAVILAEGIEDARHLARARALGATLGQGWWFGRPAEGPVSGRPTRTLRLPALPSAQVQTSPFECLPESVTLRQTTKPLLIEVSKHLEREAARLGGTCVVVSTFQHARNFTPLTARRYAGLAAGVGFVAAIGAELRLEPVPGVRGADLEPDDPIRQEWDIAVLAPHFAAALIAREVPTTRVDEERSFEFALTYDRDVVEDAARSLMSRVLPDAVLGLESAAGTVNGTSIGRSAADGPSPTDCRANGTDAAGPDAGGGAVDRPRLLDLTEGPLLEARMNSTGVAIVCLHRDPRRVADDRWGEAACRTAADGLQRRIRRRDLIAHHRDDIIVVLRGLEQGNAIEEAERVACLLQAEFAALTDQGGTCSLTVSIGISSFPADGHDVAQLVELAESRSRQRLSLRT
ncbi:MAG: EAL domain-containing protein [Nakamurella sp.]